MDSCCHGKAHELAALQLRHRRVLQSVLAINAAMCVIEVGAGVLARSSAVLADALDMFGDATVYALSLYALTRGSLWRARAVLVKGLLMAAFGAGVVVKAVSSGLMGGVPIAEAMTGVGLLALVANTACFVLLYRNRDDDLNMRSTWLCSRNDIVANLGVLAASLAVSLLHEGWPDVVVGLAIAVLFLQSAIAVLRDALGQLRAARSLTHA